MSDALDIIGQLPGEMVACLEGDDYFADIPVIAAEEGNVAQQMERKQAVITTKGGHRGAGVIVLPTLADDAHPNVRFGPMTLYPTFQVLENVELNRGPSGTGKFARQIARRIRDTVKQYQLPGLVANLKPEVPCISPLDVSRELGDGVKSCLVSFTCLEAPSEDVAVVAMVLAVAADGMVTLSCATAGAAIYFSTDGSSPLPGQAAAYREPIAVTAGTLVRARAFLAGAIPSGVARLKV